MGSLGYVDYGEVPRVIHARLILDHVIGHTYVILTPDHHIYEECLNADENEDIDRFWPGQPNGSPPRSVPANCVYGFAPMSANQVARFMNLGAAEGRRLRGELGIDVEGARQGAAQTATGGADAVDAVLINPLCAMVSTTFWLRWSWARRLANVWRCQLMHQVSVTMFWSM